jgi:hypothetical protein
MNQHSNQSNQTEINSVGVPPTPPEAHQTADLTEFFGEPIHTYSRAQALEDGYLVDVSEMAREAGIKFPVAMTRNAWADTVEWTEADSKRQTHQDESGRLWDVLWMLKCAARRGGSQLTFELSRIPRGGRGLRPRWMALRAVCSPGDTGEPVITIMRVNED